MTPQNAPEPNQADPTLVPDTHWDAAITASRAHTDARWIQISDRVRTRALRLTRRSLPITAQAPSGPIHISEQVLITYLRATLTHVPGARLDNITITTGPHNTYTGLTVTISARYDEPQLPIADTMRNLARTRLHDLLGNITPPITITTMDIHINDVHQT